MHELRKFQNFLVIAVSLSEVYQVLTSVWDLIIILLSSHSFCQIISSTVSKFSSCYPKGLIWTSDDMCDHATIVCLSFQNTDEKGHMHPPELLSTYLIKGDEFLVGRVWNCFMEKILQIMSNLQHICHVNWINHRVDKIFELTTWRGVGQEAI